MRCSVVFFYLIYIPLSSASATIYVVDPYGTGDFPTIQAAIDACSDGDIVELTDGTFTGDGNRDIDYLGKAITVRSQTGDPELCIVDCEGSEASPHVGFGFVSGEGSESVLQAVTITGGYAPGGGGAVCVTSSPTLTNCTFSGNAGIWGGGLFCIDDSSPALTNCIFSQNSAGEVGGGLLCRTSASPTLVGCTFSGNSAGLSSGGMVCFDGSSPIITNCTFADNSAGVAGGGMGCGGQDSSPILTNCTFSGNSADYGGGMTCDSSSPTLNNTIIFSTRGEAIGCCEDHQWIINTHCAANLDAR